MNCWEIKRCGREAGGTNIRRHGLCPAYPNHGEDCAFLGSKICTANIPGVSSTKPDKNTIKHILNGFILYHRKRSFVLSSYPKRFLILWGKYGTNFANHILVLILFPLFFS